jgi:hypothetical protein
MVLSVTQQATYVLAALLGWHVFPTGRVLVVYDQTYVVPPTDSASAILLPDHLLPVGQA